ncbi:MAG: DUF4282 domain-containing protein [Ketobacter sp.]|uniref:DUF4282 domain-containing protein n=1 Tax=Ketobacter sp. MCCC 1A13808 TaxID=2602738 RepID=UPI0018DE8023|nr:DUF4282 domain-containing protein [Ketobacter sp. MCCC 1A13808]
MPTTNRKNTPFSRAGATAHKFFTALFDFSFSRFITVQMFPVLYGIILTATLIAAGYFIVEAFLTSWWRGLFYLLVAGPVGFITVATIARALMEFYVVVFRISENMDEIRIITERFSGISESVESVRGFTKRLPFWGAMSGRQEDVATDNPEDPKPKRKKEGVWPY